MDTKGNILVIDDESGIREGCRRALEPSGVAVVEATNAQEGLDKINKGNTPAILESLENFYRSHYGYVVNVARNIFWPCAVIILGVMVGFVVFAMFTPVLTMIHAAVECTIP